jgi:hypothetical protein
MADDIYIECSDIKQIINISNLDIFNYNMSNNKIKIYLPKENNNLLYQDIIIDTDSTFIIIQIYKFKSPINNITHGAFIIYQNDNYSLNNNNTIFYTKNNNNLLINKITDTTMINHILNNII